MSRFQSENNPLFAAHAPLSHAVKPGPSEADDGKGSDGPVLFKSPPIYDLIRGHIRDIEKRVKTDDTLAMLFKELRHDLSLAAADAARDKVSSKFFEERLNELRGVLRRAIG